MTQVSPLCTVVGGETPQGASRLHPPPQELWTLQSPWLRGCCQIYMKLWGPAQILLPLVWVKVNKWTGHA